MDVRSSQITDDPNGSEQHDDTMSVNDVQQFVTHYETHPTSSNYISQLVTTAPGSDSKYETPVDTTLLKTDIESTGCLVIDESSPSKAAISSVNNKVKEFASIPPPISKQSYVATEYCLGNEIQYSNPSGRKRREFIPDNLKDFQYWQKRRKNNAAARRSRDKRRSYDYSLEGQVFELANENHRLRNELLAIRSKFGTIIDNRQGMPFSGKAITQSTSSLPVLAPHTIISSNTTISPVVYTSSAITIYKDKQPSIAKMPLLESSSSNSQVPIQVSPVTMSPVTISPVTTSKSPHSLRHHNTIPIETIPISPPLPIVEAVAKQAHTMATKSQESFSQAVKMYTQENVSGEFPQYIPHVKHSAVRNTLKLRLYDNHIPPGFPAQGLLTIRQPTKATVHTYQSGIPGQHSVSATAVGLHTSPHLPRCTLLPQALSDMQNEPYASQVAMTTTYSPLTNSEMVGPATVSASTSSLIGNISGDVEAQIYSQQQISQTTSALPHKLRHKLHSIDQQRFSSQVVTNSSNGLNALTEAISVNERLNQSLSNNVADSDADSVTSSGLGSNDQGSNAAQRFDPRYRERRRRNNAAARKCRENRKTLTNIREAKTNYLETENRTLRNECAKLQEEMRHLKEMLALKMLKQDEDKSGHASSADTP